MVFVGADADLGAEAELASVVEPGAGVDDDGRGVDLGDEPAGGSEAPGQYGLGVARTVAGDVGDGVVNRVDHPDGQDQVEVFGIPVGRLDRSGVGNESEGGLIAPQLDPLGAEGLGDDRQEDGRGVSVDQEGLGGVADARSMGLGVDDDPDGRVEIGFGIHVDVAIPV